MAKNCIICGKEFDAVVRMSGAVQECCSVECRTQRNRKRARMYSTDPYSKKKQDLLYRDRTKNRTLCKLCGKPTTASNSPYKPHFHDECVIQDAIETIKSGKKFTSRQYGRLHYRGLSVKDIKGNIRRYDVNGIISPKKEREE